MSTPTPIIALDVPSISDARSLIKKLGPRADFYKVGLQLFTAAGPEVIEWLHEIAAEGYTLAERPRGAEKELRLYAQTLAVDLPVGKVRK